MIARAPGKLAIGLLAVGAAAAALLLGTERWSVREQPYSLPQTAVESTPAPGDDSPVRPQAVEKLEFDFAAKLAMVPGDGWVSAQDFWEIYYSQPQKLPGNIDFGVLREFEALTAPERAYAENRAFSRQQAAATDGPVAVDDPISTQ